MESKLRRRDFLANTGLGMMGLILGNNTRLSLGRQTKGNQDFFTLRKLDDRWWLITPEGKPFFSIGLNHIDPASRPSLNF